MGGISRGFERVGYISAYSLTGLVGLLLDLNLNTFVLECLDLCMCVCVCLCVYSRCNANKQKLRLQQRYDLLLMGSMVLFFAPEAMTGLEMRSRILASGNHGGCPVTDNTCPSEDCEGFSAAWRMEWIC